MNIHESGENYLETILILQTRMQDVRSIDIANELGYSKPSISRAVGILKKNGYIEVNAMGIITLTDEGKSVASRMYERHQTLTRYLIALGVNPETASEDACRIEHVISEETFDMIRAHAKKLE